MAALASEATPSIAKAIGSVAARLKAPVASGLLPFVQTAVTLLSAIAFGGGALCVVQGARASRAASSLRRSARGRWRTAEATVLNARIDELPSGDAGRMHFRPRLLYSFQVDGIHYEGSRILVNGCGNFADQDAADRWLFEHAPGRTVTAWYDPRRPESCALLLERPARHRLLAWVAGGGLLTAAGAGALFF